MRIHERERAFLQYEGKHHSKTKYFKNGTHYEDFWPVEQCLKSDCDTCLEKLDAEKQRQEEELSKKFKTPSKNQMDEEAKVRIEEQAKQKMKNWIERERQNGNNVTNNERIFMRSRFQHKALVDEIVRGKRRAREENEDQEKKE